MHSNAERPPASRLRGVFRKASKLLVRGLKLAGSIIVAVVVQVLVALLYAYIVSGHR